MNRLRPLATGLVLIVALAIAAFFAVRAISGRGVNPRDAALQATLQRIKTDLDRPGKLPVTDPSLQSFQAWVYNTRSAFMRSVRLEAPRQFAQVVLNDPNTMPPQTLGLNQAGHPVLGIPTQAISRAFKSSDPQCGDITFSGRTLRFCATALTTPRPLRASNATGLLTVLAPQR